MKIAIQILSQTIVAGFFKNYAVPFFIVLYFCFGIMRLDHEHIAINTYLLSDPWFLVVYFTIWSGYNMLCLHFFTDAVNMPKHTFLYQLYLYPDFKKYGTLVQMHLSLFLPIIAYGLFVLQLAIKLKAWHFMIFAPLFIAFTTIYSTLYFNLKLQKPNVGYTRKSLWPLWLLRFKKPSWSFFFFETSVNQPLLFLFTKTISCVLLAACLYLFTPDQQSDLRPVMIGLLLSFAANSSLAGLLHHFENKQLLYFRNLPKTQFQVILKPLLIFALLSVPELFLAIRLEPFQLLNLDFYGTLLILPSLLIVYFSALYHPLAQNPNFANYLFGVGFICFMLILFGVPFYIFIVASLLGALYFHRKYYFSFEYLQEK